MLGAPLGLHHAQAAQARPSGMYVPAFTQVNLLSMLNLPTAIACSVAARCGSVYPMQPACTLKGGLLSIATQELLLALQRSPLALTTASRPGIPAAAGLARGPGPKDVECLHLTALQGHTAAQGSRPNATRLEVGPRESRAGSPVPRYTSQPPAMQATCQGGDVHAPESPECRPWALWAPAHAQWQHLAPR